VNQPPEDAAAHPATDAATPADRRRWPRAKADWPVQLSLPDGRFEARVRDISRAGVSFFLDRPVNLMTVLSVELDLPVEGGVRHVRGQGAVVRCEKISDRLDHYEIALFMSDLAEPDRDAVDGFVAAAAAG
jgi:hypothetical protein